MKQRDGLSNEDRRAFWHHAVSLLRESGLTVAAFARREKLSPQTLNKWKIHFIGKDIGAGHRVPNTRVRLAVQENATHSGASSSTGSLAYLFNCDFNRLSQTPPALSS